MSTHKPHEKLALIRNSTAEFLIFTGQAVAQSIGHAMKMRQSGSFRS